MTDRCCAACGSAGPHIPVQALGDPQPVRETFDYLECGDCGSLWIQSPPADLAKYYPSDYYSYGGYAYPKGLKGALKPFRDYVTLCGAGPFTSVLQRISRNSALKHHTAPFDGTAPRRYGRRSRVIDIGCGF